MANPGYAQQQSYLSAATRAKITIGLLVFGVIADLVSVLIGLSEASLIGRIIAGGAPSAAEIEANDSRTVAVGLMQMALYFVAVIAFCVWIHRANRVARSFGTAYMEFTPAWSVGWWFVPFANLIKPFQATNEIWKASDPAALDATSWQQGPTPPLLRFWWAAWLIAGFVGQASLRMSLRIMRDSAPNMQDMLNATHFEIAADLFSIVAAILAVLVVSGINERQERKRVLLQSAAAHGGPAAYQPAYGVADYGQTAAPTGYGQAPAISDPVAHYNKGVGYYQANDMARAIEEYKEAIRLNPNFAEAHYSLGLAYLAMGNKDAATIQASRLQSFSPDWSLKLYQLIRGR